MQVTKEHIQWFLDAPRRLVALDDKYTEKVERLESALTKTTTQITGMPGGGGSDRAAQLAKYIDAKAELLRWQKESNEYTYHEILKLIDSVKLSALQREILISRYYKMRAWTEVFADVCKVKPITERYMYKAHNKALEHCAEYVNTTQPDCIKEMSNYESQRYINKS